MKLRQYSVTVTELLTGRKLPILAASPVFGAAAGVTQLEFHQDLWHQKTRFLGHHAVLTAQ